MRECLFHANEYSIRINVCRNDPPFIRGALLKVGDLPLYAGDPAFYVGDPPLNVGDLPLNVGDPPFYVGDHPLTEVLRSTSDNSDLHRRRSAPVRKRSAPVRSALRRSAPMGHRRCRFSIPNGVFLAKSPHFSF